MSSPNFNNVTVVGCMLCYVEVFLSTYSNSPSATQNPSLCYVRGFYRKTNIVKFDLKHFTDYPF